MNKLKFTIILIFLSLILNACNGKLPGADARKVSYDPNERVRKNLEEGRGFRIDDAFGKKGSGNFEFASSNELWRASLDTIDFIPIATANYSGGILITDWYSENEEINESIKISIRFLTNEIRSDSLKIKVYTKNCENIDKCTINEDNPEISTKLVSTILTKATKYKQEKKNKDD